MSKKMKFYIYLIEKYAEYKNISTTIIVNKLEELNLTKLIYNMYEQYHIEAIENAVDVFPDGERKTNGIIDKCKDLEILGFKPEILDLRNYFGKKDELFEFLKTRKAYYAIGGNAFVLRTAMKLSGFDEYLKMVSKLPDYLYSGFSAGICVLSTDLRGIHLVDPTDIYPYEEKITTWEGIGLIDYMPVPHYDTPEHKESSFMYDVVKYLEKNNLPYRTLRDGDVIIEDLSANKKIQQR